MAEYRIFLCIWGYIGGGYSIEDAEGEIDRFVRQYSKPKVVRKTVKYIDKPTRESSDSK